MPKKWRNDPATKSQIRYLKRLGVTFPKDISKGMASDLIEKAIAGQPADFETRVQLLFLGIKHPKNITDGAARKLISEFDDIDRIEAYDEWIHLREEEEIRKMDKEMEDEFRSEEKPESRNYGCLIALAILAALFFLTALFERQ